MCKSCLKLTQYVCDLCESEKVFTHLGVVPTNGKDVMNVIMLIMKIDLSLVHVKDAVINIKIYLNFSLLKILYYNIFIFFHFYIFSFLYFYIFSFLYFFIFSFLYFSFYNILDFFVIFN